MGPNNKQTRSLSPSAEILNRFKILTRFEAPNYGFSGAAERHIRGIPRHSQKQSCRKSSKPEKNRHSEKIARADFEKNGIFRKFVEILKI